MTPQQLKREWESSGKFEYNGMIYRKGINDNSAQLLLEKLTADYTIHFNDKPFLEHRENGQAGCYCSRCGNIITKNDFAVRVNKPLPKSGVTVEYRYHEKCFFHNGSDSL